MHDWTNNFIAKRGESVERAKRSAALTELARQATPSMVTRLVKRLRLDVGVYSAGSGADLNSSLIPFGVQIVRSKLPFAVTITMQATPDDAPTIRFTQRIREASSGEDQPEQFTIEVFSDGQDNHYYRVGGKDFASEEEVSEVILTPIFSAIDRAIIR